MTRVVRLAASGGGLDDAVLRLQHWRAMLAALPDAAWIVDIATRRVVLANDAAARLLARPVASLVGAPADSLLATPEDMAYWDDPQSPPVQAMTSDTVLGRPDGQALPVQRSIHPLPGTDGEAGCGFSLVTLVDRSRERQAEVAHEAAVAELRATLESTADGILVTDLAGHIRSFNRRFAQLWAIPEDLLEAGDQAAVQDWMRRSVSDPDGWQRHWNAIQEAPLLSTSDPLRLHSGEVLDCVSRPLWQRGRPAGRVYSFRDQTRQLAADRRIEQLTSTDALTGLPNRRRLAERVLEAAVRARRSGEGFAFLLVDLDRFRQINDSLGHDVGDQVLQTVAQRIQGCMRQDDEIARVGGDQFAVLVHTADAAAAETMARRVLNAVAQPCNLDSAPFTLTCSIGVALCPTHGRTLDELVSHAETAMRAVKDGGRANFRFHQVRPDVDRRSFMRLDHAMRQALVSGRFRLAYQPQVDLATGAVVGAEALIRWRDPELGDVSPGQFIPVAEETGFIVAIGDWVLSQAMRQAALWHERGHDMPIAVNVSALQFQQAQFVDRVASVLAVTGLPPHLLELELTESILVRDADEALARLHALSRLGLRLAIDDFGTGYSSLAYLKRFPIEKLKIDRSFVKGLPDDDSDAGIVRAILQMARALELKVIAEGVETEAQRQFLLAAGCAQFQGFLYSPAVDPRTFEQRMLTQPTADDDAG